MKKLNHIMAFVLLVGLLLATAHIISAQQQGARQRQRRQFRQIDPAEMLNRMVERAMERVSLSEEEAAVIKPKIEGILKTRMDQNSEIRELTGALQEAVDAGDSDQMTAKLTALKKKRKEYREKSEAMEKELIELLTIEQEAQLTLAGTVNSGGGFGGFGFGGFRGQPGQRNRPGGGQR